VALHRGKGQGGHRRRHRGGAAGVPREAIIADYLSTNQYLAEDIRRLTALVKAQSGRDDPAADESLFCLFGARREFIDSFFAAAEERFGSFAGFVGAGLGLSPADLALLMEKYTE
jgi:protein-tyrosine phosphatase